jgi:hypothetical protein
MSGILPSIIFPSDIQAVQQRLGAAASGTDGSVGTCAKLDNATRAAWLSFYSAVQAYVAMKPAVIPWGSGEVATTGSLYDQGLSYEKELFAWQQKLSGVCALAVPVFDPTPIASPINDFVKWGAIAAGFLGSAYVVAKVVELIPKPAPRQPRELAR